MYKILSNYRVKNDKKKLNQFVKDLADLTTTILIIAGLSLSAIVAIGGIAYATRDNAKQSADCISNYSALNTTTNIDDNCRGSRNDGEENSEDGDNQPPIGDNPDDEEIIPTSDNCFLLNETGDTIVKYKIELEECSTDVIIPESINNITIKHVGDYAFINETGLTIEDISFGITSVEFPNTIETIGIYAFAYNDMTNITIPDSVETIEEFAFYNNPLQSLRITENPNYTTIENGTFSFFCGVTGNCSGKPNTSNIDLLEIPNNIKTIESNAFEKMQIRELTIPSSVETIEGHAFQRTGVERVNFNNGLISIGYNSFRGNNIEGLVLPETLESIGSSAFSYNKKLLNNGLVIPYSVREIGIGSFTESGGNYINRPIVMIPNHTHYYPGNDNLKSFNESFITIVRY